MKKNPHILKLVDEYRYRKGIVITDEKSVTYKVFKVIYFLSFLWTFVFNMLFLIGSLISYNFSEVKINTTPAITLLIATVVLITGLILLIKKLYIPAGILNIFSVIMFIIQYYTLLLNDIQLQGISHFFYWRHLFPGVIVLFSCIALCIIGLKCKALLNRDYKKMLEKIYLKNTSKLSDINDDDWQQLLESGELFDDRFEKKEN